MSTPEPTIQELIDIAGKAIRGSGDKTADFIRGSDYEALIGPTAIIWTRQARRDTDLFNSINFHTADGEDLTDMARRRYGKDRILDTRGQGSARLVRPSAGIAETIWSGTRLFIPGPSAKFYRTTRDVEVLSTALFADLPLEAVEIGPGSATTAVAPGSAIIGDVLEDASWTVQSLSCADGTLFEKADVFRERIRRERLEARVGQERKIVSTCNALGASQVAIFRSNFAGDDYDHGLNVVYVGDQGNSGSPELVKACFLALQSVRVLGDHLQVLPMARAELDVTATVYLRAAPVLFDLARFEYVHHSSISQYLNGRSGSYTFSLDGIRGAIARHTPDVQRVVLTTPVADGQVVVGSQKNFPAVLNRYVPGKISLRYESV